MSAMRTQKKKGRKAQSIQRENRQVYTVIDQLRATTVTYVRRISSAETTVSTNASGVIPLTTIVSSQGVFTAPDFAAGATLYQLYRVKAIQLMWFPFYPVPLSTTTAPALVYVTPFRNNNTVVSIQGHIDASGTLFCTGYRGGKAAVAWKGDPEAHFWTPVSAAVPVAESYGLTLVGTNVASTINTPIWRVIATWIVEFRMAS